MEKKVAERRKSVKNLYDAKSGLPIMINLYVIKYIYYHIQKHERFIEKKEKGKKAKSYEIYQNEIPMSRQRMDRINKGMTFEITAAEADFLIERFGIDMKYFRKENPISFEIEGIGQTDWKCFFNERHKGIYEMPSSFTKENIKSRANNVENKLRELTDGGWEKDIKKTNPIYAICYYFRNGNRYNALSSIEVLRESLKAVSFRDWEGEDKETLKKDYLLLYDHCCYINSLITIGELREKK